MSKNEKIDQIWQLQVYHPRLKEVLTSIKECHNSYFRKGEAVNLFISGDTGVGKTTICRSYVSKFPIQKGENGFSIPVLYTRTPTSPTMKSLTTKLLAGFKDPAAHKGTFNTQKLRLKELVKDCGTQIIFLDELQHLIDPDSERILKAVSNLVKELIDELEIPIVMIGLPESEIVLSSNLQLGRRVSQRESLSRFRWRNKSDQKNFRSLLKTIDGILPLEKSSELATVEIAQRIHHASKGVMAHIMRLIRQAAELAVERDEKRITLPMLSQAYDKHIANIFPERPNPFNERYFSLKSKAFPQRGGPPTQKGVSNRIRPKQKKESVASVLSKR